jgi:aryl-alcohol dehydrogenase-like predicted oxidoreductase
MRERILGDTGLRISELGYGCGGFWGMDIFPEKSASELVHTAIENGITLFDTGPNYSQANAEPRLGRILKSVDKSKLVIATKTGSRYANGKHYKDYSLRGMEESSLNSMKNLGLDYIPLLQIHTPYEHQLTDDLLNNITKIKEKGIAQYIGISGDGKLIEWAIRSGVFDTVMLTYNIIHQKPIELIKIAREKGIGVLIKSPMAHGLYNNDIFKIRKLSDIWYLLRVLKNYRYDLMQGRKYRFINDVDGWKGSEVALKFVLDNDAVSCAVIGTTRLNHLQENIESVLKTLPNEIYSRIEVASH